MINTTNQAYKAILNLIQTRPVLPTYENILHKFLTTHETSLPINQLENLLYIAIENNQSYLENPNLKTLDQWFDTKTSEGFFQYDPDGVHPTSDCVPIKWMHDRFSSDLKTRWKHNPYENNQAEFSKVIFKYYGHPGATAVADGELRFPFFYVPCST